MCATAVYLKNRLPHSAVKDQTPYEVLHGKKPTISHLQLFGTECFVHIPEEARPSGSKLQPRAEKGWFVGYNESTKISWYTYHQKDRLFVPAMFTSLRVITQKGYNHHLHPCLQLHLPVLHHYLQFRPLPLLNQSLNLWLLFLTRNFHPLKTSEDDAIETYYRQHNGG